MRRLGVFGPLATHLAAPLAPTLALGLALMLGARPALAVLPSEQLANPRLEARAHAIGETLRCLVCQNETIEDSDAALAGDLRRLVRQRVLAGDSDDQVRAYLVARYGHWVLLKPPFEPDTLLLWLGPVGVILIGGVGLATLVRRRRAGEAEAPLSPDEEAALSNVMTRRDRT
ncbi:MAG: cytochrome c-type biogenesis protein CcmH [Alphaproteobacteria bacterium]|nr:cytochrome c-type biogenesis protein CcmH [Alphaproteobacteria bacterium]